MPNWCSEVYVFYGENKKEKKKVIEFRDLIIKAMETSAHKWVGDIHIAAGLGEPTMYCRSFVSEVSDIEEDGSFKVWLESAWGSFPDFWCHLIEAAYPAVCYARIADEPGNGLYEVHDPEGRYFTDRFFFDACEAFDLNGAYVEPEYFEEVNDVLEYVHDLLGWDVKTFDELEERLNEYNRTHDGFMCCHEYEEVEI